MKPKLSNSSALRLVAAAREEFSRRGFDGARVEQNARRAGVNKQLLFYYFHSKRGLFTAVLRWEYRPGSTLFIVWTQGRFDQAGAEGSRSMGGDFRDLFDLHPDNTFLVKASYWINW